MFSSQRATRFSRRIAAYFLLFGIGALIWLGFGAVYVAHVVTNAHSESAALRWVGVGSSRSALSYLRDKEAGLQQIVEDIRSKSGAGYCAVVSADGRYMAHSNSKLIEQTAEERSGSTERWGDVLRVEFIDANGTTVDEYRAPLQAGETVFGSLRLGLVRPTV